MKWFRLYDELVDDPKMILLPADIFRNVIFLWCIASQNDGHLPAVEAVAVKLRLPVAKTRKLLADLKSRGLVDERDGQMQPHNWNGRQFKGDGASTERVKRFRKRSKDDPGNGGETFHETVGETLHETKMKQPQSQRQNQKQNQMESQQHSSESVLRERAPGSLISPEAFAIADELAEMAGFTRETWPPGWCGAAYTIQKFLTEGCPGDVIKLAVKAVLDRRKPDGPPENFVYFAKPIAAAFANFQRPNPVASPQAFNGSANGNVPRKRTVIDAGRDLIAKLQILENEADAGSGTSDAPPRLLPPH